MGCTREEQLRWWAEAYRAVVAARVKGVDARAVTAWALFGSFDWDSLLVRREGRYEPGAFDLRGSSPRPTALARAIRTRSLDHPVLDTPGWWRRPSSTAQSPRRLLITDGECPFGRALARACASRGIEHVVACRSVDTQTELEGGESGELRAVIQRERPWAVVDTRGDWMCEVPIALLAHAVLDLLIDGEDGVWQLTNDGVMSALKPTSAAEALRSAG